MSKLHHHSGENMYIESLDYQPEYFQEIVKKQTDVLLQKTRSISQGDTREIRAPDTLGETDEWKGYLASLTEDEKDELFKQVTHSINSSYWVFNTMASTLDSTPSPVEAIAYDFDAQEIPDNILPALEIGVRDIAFEALGTTRLQHYRDIMEAIRAQAKPLRLGQNRTVLTRQGNTIIFQQPTQDDRPSRIQVLSTDRTNSVLSSENPNIARDIQLWY